ncbi:MAG: amidohydrolase family protein [Candidatus Marinimicrobia bacterium]|nr:amidohydrolase family protein [Candidatus Neomarinimicrobiota bacterium]MCF7880642.1 amidohydrolase family protein [Candidatus Neomarinimicrobiota bacterium]
MILDSHQHFWHYSPEEFDWISNEMTRIRQDFLPGDLTPILQKNRIDGTIAVQARQTTEETDWLIDLADQHKFIKGVVGWVPLAEENVEQYLEKYGAVDCVKGVRHVIHDEPDDQYILRGDFNQGVGLLKNYDLVYDILVFEKHLPQTIAFVDRHPEQIFVLDHVGKPRIKDNVLEPWRTHITELAERENVCCKLSGMVTESDFTSWKKEQLQQYFNVILKSFGADRLLFGSDWPVCLVAAEYEEWLQIVHNFISTLSETKQRRILCKTAREVYGI